MCLRHFVFEIMYLCSTGIGCLFFGVFEMVIILITSRLVWLLVGMGLSSGVIYFGAKQYQTIKTPVQYGRQSVHEVLNSTTNYTVL